MSKTEYIGAGQEHRIMEVKKDGQRLELDDLSRWDIPPGPSTKVACWYSTQRVLVEESEGDAYYILTNLDTPGRDTVRARFVPRRLRLPRQ